jgi:pyruvate/2-oxoglutarate dehydrogenase complex dihydrolipoamide dehydrogenase (E3) component
MIVPMKRYDLVVIGAGSGGLVAAEYAARFGASVALIEKSELLGGDCLNQGCVPSKALIYAGKTFYRARHAEKFGTMTYPELDFDKVKQSIEQAKQRIRSLRDNDDYYERLGVDIYHEHARFISTNKIKAGNREIQGRHFIISTGSRPRIPDIPGLSKVDVYTNETIFDIEKFPRRLGVIGGGVIGCEIASAFNHLGSEVTLFERHGYLSLRADKDASEFVQDRFLQRGMKIKTKSAVDSLKESKKGIKIDYTIKKKELLKIRRCNICVNRYEYQI